MPSAWKNTSLEARRRVVEQRERADARLRASKHNRGSPRRQIELGLSKATGSGQLAWWVAMNVPVGGGPYVRALRDVLLACADRRSPMLGHEQYVHALANLARQWAFWLESPGTWKPRTHNVRRQFASLARHLLARYPVPACFDSAWFGYLGPHPTAAGWFVHIGRGNNLRTASALPFPLTKMMAHHALRAPDDLDATQALRWAQVRALGGGERLARAVVATRLRDSCPDEPFWLTVVHFLVNHQAMLDPHQVGPIVDYLYAQRFEAEEPRIVGGVLRAGRVPQPNLSMKGRTVESLVRQVHAWHRTLHRSVDVRKLVWPPSGIRGYERLEGTEAGHHQRLFRVSELLSSAALCDEGRAMRHCVASYASSCSRGYCAIFSLTEDDGHGPQRRLTIEVVPKTRTIVEASGRMNRRPDPVDLRILRAWATVAGLKLPADESRL